MDVSLLHNIFYFTLSMPHSRWTLKWVQSSGQTAPIPGYWYRKIARRLSLKYINGCDSSILLLISMTIKLIYNIIFLFTFFLCRNLTYICILNLAFLSCPWLCILYTPNTTYILCEREYTKHWHLQASRYKLFLRRNNMEITALHTKHD